MPFTLVLGLIQHSKTGSISEPFGLLNGRNRKISPLQKNFLLSNQKLEPVDLLTEYFGRTDIEGEFKTSKDYLGLLPLAKWYADTVRGKILNDIMNAIIFLNMRKALNDSGLSVREVTGKTQSHMCFHNKHGEILIETPSKKVKAYYKLIGEAIPASLKIKDFRRKVLLS